MLDTIRSAMILALAESLRTHDSWCGETHLQKAMFFLQENSGVSAGFEFVLYKHGPYSFDLHDELSSLFAHCLLEDESCPPYGPRIKLSESGDHFLDTHGDRLGEMRAKIEEVAAWFGSKGVMELEKYATALWVRLHHADAEIDLLARKVNEIKPHISEEAAKEALTSIP